MNDAPKHDAFTLVGRDIAVTGGRGVVNDPGRIGDWSQTWTGTRFYPLDPRPDDVKLPDLVIGLGNMARYNGQTRFYSVGEHTVIVSKMLMDDEILKIIGVPEELEQYPKEELSYIGLHHDDPEFLMADVTRPFKRAMGRDNSYFVIEDNIWRKAIAPRFGLPAKIPQTVLNADVMLLGLEKKVLCPRSDLWQLPFPIPAGYKINCFQPPYTFWMWIKRYAELSGASEIALKKEVERMMLEDRAAFEAQFERPLVNINPKLPT